MGMGLGCGRRGWWKTSRVTGEIPWDLMRSHLVGVQVERMMSDQVGSNEWDLMSGILWDLMGSHLVGVQVEEDEMWNGTQMLNLRNLVVLKVEQPKPRQDRSE